MVMVLIRRVGSGLDWGGLSGVRGVLVGEEELVKCGG